jgi:hypothetical protein
MSICIPDIAERFSEGYYGEDLTEKFFPTDCKGDEDIIWTSTENNTDIKEREIQCYQDY